MMNDNSKKVYFVFEYANGAVVVLCSLLCGCNCGCVWLTIGKE